MTSGLERPTRARREALQVVGSEMLDRRDREDDVEAVFTEPRVLEGGGMQLHRRPVGLGEQLVESRIDFPTESARAEPRINGVHFISFLGERELKPSKAGADVSDDQIASEAPDLLMSPRGTRTRA